MAKVAKKLVVAGDKIQVHEWFFLIAFGVVALSVFLPFVSLFGISISLISVSGSAWLFILGSGAAIGLFFYKKFVAGIVGLVLSGSCLIYLIYKIATSAEMLGSNELGISVFSFLSIGAYLLMIGLVASTIASIVLIVRNKA